MKLVALALALVVGFNVDPEAGTPGRQSFDRPTETIRLSIGRVLGNNLPPLQGVAQARQNMAYVLQHETLPTERCINYGDDGEIEQCFDLDFFWVINRIVNHTEYKLLWKMIKKSNTRALDIPLDGEFLKRVVQPAVYVTNQNAARNEGLTESFALGAMWASVIDGNTFITDEGLDGILRNIAAAESKTKKYALIPMYRAVPEPHAKWLSWDSKVVDIFPKLSRQEAHVAFRYDAAEGFFPEVGTYSGYGQNNKFVLIAHLVSKKKDALHCRKASSGYAVKTMASRREDTIVHDCGAVIRLSYHSMLGNHDNLVLSPVARQRPRRDGIKLLGQMIADVMGTPV
eukprot:Polyplicarium_translucidae@DN3785_c0_g1_i1.p1